MDKVDNIVDANGAKWFLRALGLHVPESVIMKAVAALRSDASETLYNLYARGRDKVGKERVPICGKTLLTRSRSCTKMANWGHICFT